MGRCYSEVCAYYLGRTITGPLTATASPLLTVLVRAGRGTRHQPATSQLSSQDSLVWLHSSSLGTAAHNLFILHAECGVVVHTAQLHPGPHASVQCPCFVAVSCRVAAWATHGAALSTLRCSHKAARSTRKLSLTMVLSIKRVVSIFRFRYLCVRLQERAGTTARAGHHHQYLPGEARNQGGRDKEICPAFISIAASPATHRALL